MQKSPIRSKDIAYANPARGNEYTPRVIESWRANNFINFWQSFAVIWDTRMWKTSFAETLRSEYSVSGERCVSIVDMTSARNIPGINFIWKQFWFSRNIIPEIDNKSIDLLLRENRQWLLIIMDEVSAIFWEKWLVEKYSNALKSIVDEFRWSIVFVNLLHFPMSYYFPVDLSSVSHRLDQINLSPISVEQTREYLFSKWFSDLDHCHIHKLSWWVPYIINQLLHGLSDLEKGYNQEDGIWEIALGKIWVNEWLSSYSWSNLAWVLKDLLWRNMWLPIMESFYLLNKQIKDKDLDGMNISGIAGLFEKHWIISRRKFDKNNNSVYLTTQAKNIMDLFLCKCLFTLDNSGIYRINWELASTFLINTFRDEMKVKLNALWKSRSYFSLGNVSYLLHAFADRISNYWTNTTFAKNLAWTSLVSVSPPLVSPN